MAFWHQGFYVDHLVRVTVRFTFHRIRPAMVELETTDDCVITALTYSTAQHYPVFAEQIGCVNTVDF